MRGIAVEPLLQLVDSNHRGGTAPPKFRGKPLLQGGSLASKRTQKRFHILIRSRD